MKYLYTIALFFCTGTIAYACTCKRIGTVKSQKAADVVFVGKIIEKRDVTDESGSNFKDLKQRTFEYVFMVKQIHKGRKSLTSKKKIVVVSDDNYSFCDVEFEVNEKYLVYGYRPEGESNKDFLTTGICAGTKKHRFFTFLKQIVLELT